MLLGLEIQDLEFGIWESGFKIWELGFRIRDLGLSYHSEIRIRVKLNHYINNLKMYVHLIPDIPGQKLLSLFMFIFIREVFIFG